MMTPTEFLASLAERGLRVSTTKAGRLRVEPRARLTAADRLYVSDHATAILAALALAELLAQDAADAEARQRARAEREAAEAQRLAERARRDTMAAWDEAKVVALVEAGKLDAAAVREWHEARRELSARVTQLRGARFAAAVCGLEARIVWNQALGGLVLEVAPVPGRPAPRHPGSVEVNDPDLGPYGWRR